MNKNVKRRETFYIAGYDPRGARHYHNLYKKEAIKQSEINNMKFSISSRKRTETNVQSWQIDTSSQEKHTQTNYHYLEWDDIIRENWKKSFFSLFVDLLFYFKTYILAGRFIKYIKVSPRQMIGIFFPIVYLFLSIAISVLFGNFIFHLLNNIYGIFLGSIGAIILIYLLFELGNRLALFWLLRIFVFSGRYVFEEMKTLEERLEQFSTHLAKVIDEAKENNIDEVLLASHSVGAILTIPLLEKTLNKLTKSIDIELSILVLGECIPLVSGINKAKDYKEKMTFLAKREDLFWLDYTTVIDGACFPSLNYFSDAKINIEKQKNFHFLSPRFHTLFSKEKYNKMRKNRYLTHFVYLMATEYEGKYDFFKMTAGHQFLCDTL